MVKKNINTFNTESFVDKYVEPAPMLRNMMHKDFGKFFIVPVQDMLSASKLPVPPMKSTGHTIIFLSSGEANMRIGFQQFRIVKGQCLVVAAGQVFSYDKPEKNTGFLIHFVNDFVAGYSATQDVLKEYEFLNVWAHPHISTDKQHAGYITNLLSRMLNEYAISGVRNQQLMRVYLNAYLSELQLAYAPKHTRGSNGAAVALANRFRAMVYANYKTMQLVGDYAAELNVSPNHLNKTVKAVTSISPTKWIDEVRITEAKVLLFQTDYSISEIAAEVGIEDSSYFSRLFKKYEGVTPVAYRKMIEMS